MVVAAIVLVIAVLLFGGEAAKGNYDLATRDQKYSKRVPGRPATKRTNWQGQV